MGNFFYRANIAQLPFFGNYSCENPSLETLVGCVKGKRVQLYISTDLIL